MTKYRDIKELYEMNHWGDPYAEEEEPEENTDLDDENADRWAQDNGYDDSEGDEDPEAEKSNEEVRKGISDIISEFDIEKSYLPSKTRTKMNCPKCSYKYHVDVPKKYEVESCPVCGNTQEFKHFESVEKAGFSLDAPIDSKPLDHSMEFTKSREIPARNNPLSHQEEEDIQNLRGGNTASFSNKNAKLNSLKEHHFEIGDNKDIRNSTAAIDAEASPMRIKTKLQERILGNVKFLLEKYDSVNESIEHIGEDGKPIKYIRKYDKYNGQEVYLRDGEKAPDNVKVKIAPRGIRYYEKVPPQAGEWSLEKGQDKNTITEQTEAQNVNRIPQDDSGNTSPSLLANGREVLINKITTNQSDFNHFNKVASEERKESLNELLKTDTDETISKLHTFLSKSNDMITNAERISGIQDFLKGYKDLAMIGYSIDPASLNDTLFLAKSIDSWFEFKTDFTGLDHLSKVIQIDSVAHKLHQDKFEDGTSRYRILDDLAKISKSFGEVDRVDRLLVLQREEIPTFELEILQKGVESSSSFWNLMVKAIKGGVKKLSDDEVVLLREWVYARI
jgi:hypothetical protein